ncbi:MAG TPA: alpha/beta hydrolase [Actinomycetota bacterium]|nr:alpha/beta hydrolase [Actinomycetota bacterium]
MSATPQMFSVPVDGGRLNVAKWGDRGPVVWAAHGITANYLMWQPVADLIAGEVQLVAPDLRGRGDSGKLPGPYGMAAHVRDAIATLDAMRIDDAVIVGGSMGGYVAVLLAAQHPDRVRAVGLCDGGVALPVPDGIDPDEMLKVTLGPTMDRLDMTFDSLDDYVAFWRKHPALADEWNEYIQAYVVYDYETTPDGTIKTKVSKDAIVADGRDLLTNKAVHECISDIKAPVWLLRAPRGLLNQPQPLISDDMLAVWRGDRLPQLEDEMLSDINHFTLFLTDPGAKAIAERIRSSI